LSRNEKEEKGGEKTRYLKKKKGPLGKESGGRKKTSLGASRDNHGGKKIKDNCPGGQTDREVIQKKKKNVVTKKKKLSRGGRKTWV